MWNAAELAAPSNRTSHRGCDHSDAWLQALEEATACLRDGHATADDLDHCSAYLNELEAVLRTKEDRWDFPPNTGPPLWESSGGGNGTANNGNTHVNQEVRRTTGVNNRFATFQDNDSHGDDESLSSRSEDDEAGDRPVLNREPHDHNDAPYIACMDMRRLMIRISNAQSDVFAAKALLFRKQSPPAWTVGAEQYTHCLHKIHAALILADSEISKWIAADTVDDRTLLLLTEDANIVEVSVQSMTANRESYLAAARQQEAYLVRKLEPQWQSRDVVKARMGDRWVQNERPKNNYARLRADHEKQLADIRKAVQCLEQMDTAAAELSSKRLKDKLLESQQRAFSTTQRYNGQRPVDLSRRVDQNLYPDPTLFGWLFTGSSGVTEFFEKEGVKLDWYFTTATIKTSLDHPVQGRTQLFGARVDPDTYRAILENPRTHTGNRYHQRGPHQR
jgi:hypothetical protein